MCRLLSRSSFCRACSAPECSFSERLCASFFSRAPMCLHCACVRVSKSTCVPALCLCASLAHTVSELEELLSSLCRGHSLAAHATLQRAHSFKFPLQCVILSILTILWLKRSPIDSNDCDTKKGWIKWLWKQSSSSQMSCEVYRVVVISSCWQTKDEYFPHQQLSER